MYEKWMWINVRGKITCGSVFLYPILGLCFVSCEFAVANFRLNVEASYLRACIFYIVCWIPNVEGRFKAYTMCAHRKFCFIFIDSETHLIARFDDSLLHWVTGPSLGNCAPRSVMLKKGFDLILRNIPMNFTDGKVIDFKSLNIREKNENRLIIYILRNDLLPVAPDTSAFTKKIIC